MHVCTGSVLIRKEVINIIGGQRKDLRITEGLEFGLWYLPMDNGDLSRKFFL